MTRSIHCFRPPELATTELEFAGLDPTASLTRRRFLAGGGLVLISAALGATAGCGRSAQLTPLEQLPADPQRIIVGNTILLDALLALGAPVIGAPTFGDRVPLPPYLASYAADAQSVGTTTAPDLETVAALEPDLSLIPDSGRVTVLRWCNAFYDKRFFKKKADKSRNVDYNNIIILYLLTIDVGRAESVA